MRFLIVVLSVIFYLGCYASDDAVVIKVISAENGDALPYSSVMVLNKGMRHTDERGVAVLNANECRGAAFAVTCFGYATESFVLEGTQDTVFVRLKESPVMLAETVVRPMKKDKDITVGRQKLNLGIFNKGKFYPPFMPDSTLRELEPYEFGFEFKAPENKLNRLRAFGMNVLPGDSMLNQLDITISIYDMEGHDPLDTITIPTPIMEPIQLKYKASEVNRSRKEFRYEFPAPIDLPTETIIIVNIRWSMEDGIYTTEGKELAVLLTRNGKWYKEGNPYKEYNPPYSGKKKHTPFFWEYTQYSLPEEDG